MERADYFTFHDKMFFILNTESAHYQNLGIVRNFRT